MSYSHFDSFPAHILSVYSMCFYQMWRIANRATRNQKGSEANLKAGMLFRIYSSYCLAIKGLPSLIYDLPAATIK